MKNKILFGNEPGLSDWQRKRVREIRGNNPFGFKYEHIERMEWILAQFPLEIIARDTRIPEGMIVWPHFVVHTPKGYLTNTLLVPIIDFQNYEISPVEEFINREKRSKETRYIVFREPSFERWCGLPPKPACEVYHFDFFEHPELACTFEVEEMRNSFRTWKYGIGIPKESLVRP